MKIIIFCIFVLFFATLMLIGFRRKKIALQLNQMMVDASANTDGQTKNLVAPPYELISSKHGTMLVNSNDLYLGRAIICYGECAEYEIDFLYQFLSVQPGVVVEVGTNIGTHTIAFAKALKLMSREMVVFEPQPFVFQNMCANLALNGISNVRAWPWACGLENSNVYFPKQNYFDVGNFGGVSMSTTDLSDCISVPCVRLDDILGTEQVSFIKIDAEGFELMVLRGAQSLIDTSRPILYVENDRQDKCAELIEWLWSKNYKLWWHLPPLFNENNFFRNDLNIYPEIVSINMLCVPAELALTIVGLEAVVNTSYPLN